MPPRLRFAFVVALVFGCCALSAAASPAVVPYHGVLKKDGRAFTGTAEMKFAILDHGEVLWSSDALDPGTGAPGRGVAVQFSEGTFKVGLGAAPMMPIDIVSLRSHPEAILRVWVSTGGRFEQLADQTVRQASRATEDPAESGFPGAIPIIEAAPPSVGQPPGADVRVINTTAEPVPVSLQGTGAITGDVNVVNQPTVKLADARTPFQGTLFFRTTIPEGGSGGQPVGGVTAFDVPVGQRLVIEHITSSASLGADEAFIWFYVSTRAKRVVAGHYLSPTRLGSGPEVPSWSSASFWAASHPVKIYADGGSTVQHFWLTSTRSGTSHEDISVTYSGYLEPEEN